MSVDLIDHMGDDLKILNASRVSVGKRSTVMPSWGPKRIGSLLEQRHASPFEHVVFTFHIICPIGVAREWQRHRDSYSEISTRYHEMEPKYCMPTEVRRQIGKPGEYSFEAMHPDESAQALQMMTYAYRDAYGKYQALLAVGVAHEVARNVLPLGLMTEMWWTVKARAVLNFLSLRTAPSALLEIRQEAEEVERLVTTIIPVTMEAWNACGRKSL